MALAVALGACATPAERIDQRAERAGLTRHVIDGAGFRHLVYERDAPGDSLLIFIEGDGQPWIQRRYVAEDPTPFEPLALDLMLQTEGPVAYLGRPCYFALADSACDPGDWTHGRFSRSIVDSMVSAATTVAERFAVREVVLVGYSGGGALAVLMANDVPGVRGVVTVAGLLDTDRWVAHHGYEPLQESINPAGVVVSQTIRVRHLVGDRDEVVPYETVRRVANHTELVRYPDYDHVCCWRDNWAAILRQLEMRVGRR